MPIKRLQENYEKKKQKNHFNIGKKNKKISEQHINNKKRK